MGSVARRSATKQAAQARRLIAGSQQPLPFIIKATIQCPDQFAGRDIVLTRTCEPLLVGTLFVPTDKLVYLIRCKCAPTRWYAAVQTSETTWKTSIEGDANHRAMVIGKAQKHRAYLQDQIIARQEVGA
jgi:hypothetical protein